MSNVVIFDVSVSVFMWVCDAFFYFLVIGKGTPTRQVLGKSKMILGLLEGIPTMLKGEVAVVNIR